MKPFALLLAMVPALIAAPISVQAQQSPRHITDSSARIWVNAQSAGALNLRAGPSTQHRVLRAMPHGAALTLLSREGSWARVVHNDTGTVGWAHQSYFATQKPEIRRASSAVHITPKPPAREPAAQHTYRVDQTAWVVAPRGRLNMRSGPSTRFPIRTRLPDHMRLEVIARHGDWRQVRLANGQRGWVHENFLTGKRPNLKRKPDRHPHHVTPKRPSKGGHAQDKNRMSGRIVLRLSN